MIKLISKAMSHIGYLLNELQVKRFLAVVLVGFMLLTTNINSDIESGRHSQAVTKKIDKVIHQDDSQRPKTTGEWNREARETEGAPGERLKNIVEESAEAVKDMGSVYPNTAERSTDNPQGNKVR
jgi:hypothetical protein